MFKTLAAGAAAALALHVTDVASRISGTAATDVPASPRVLKADHSPARVADPGCGQAAWPHYEARCVRTETGDRSTQARQVRIIAFERQPAKSPAN
jgi:hypothetical protein